MGKLGKLDGRYSGEFCQLNCDYKKDCSGNGVCNAWGFDSNSIVETEVATVSSISTGITAKITAPTAKPAPTAASASSMVIFPRGFHVGKCLCDSGFAGDHCEKSVPRISSSLILSVVLGIALALQFYLWRRQSVRVGKSE